MQTIFQSGFTWILLATILYGGVHSLLASNPIKQLAARLFGDAGLYSYRLFFNIVGFLTLLPVLALVVILPDQVLYRIGFPYLGLTLTLQTAAFLGMVGALRQTGTMDFLGIHQAIQKENWNPPERLVKRGFYRLVRHPLYFFGLVIIWLTPFMTWNILALDLGFSAYLLVGAKYEERKLLREFGQEYAEYQSNTPMVLPDIRKIFLRKI